MLHSFPRPSLVAHLRFSIGDHAWSDEEGSSLPFSRQDANQIASKTVELLRGLDDVDDPSALRVSGSGPASAVSVLATGGFLSFSRPDEAHPAQRAALAARMTATIDVDGDVIEAAAREVGERAFVATKNGSIAAIAAAAQLARLRTWVDPFTPTPQTGYMAGGLQETSD